MASLETTRGRKVPAWQQANHYYQQPVDYVNVRESQTSTAPATRRRRNTNGGYTIQKGDTLSAIARRYGTSVQALAEANGIEDVNKIYIGDNLRIPGSNNTQSTNSSTQRQTARPATTRNNNNDNYVPTTGKTLPEFNVNDTNNNIYRATRDLPDVNATSNRMSNDDMIKARYQRQINNQRARDEYYRNQRMAQGRRAEQRVAARPNYKGLETFANVAAAAPAAYLFGTAATPYIMQGAESYAKSRVPRMIARDMKRGLKNTKPVKSSNKPNITLYEKPKPKRVNPHKTTKITRKDLTKENINKIKRENEETLTRSYFNRYR